MRPVVLVGCGKQKAARPAPAAELYTSTLFQLSRKWAETHGQAWAVLSAFHGVVEPAEVLAPYNWTMADHRWLGRGGPDGIQLPAAEHHQWLAALVQAFYCGYHPAPLVILAGPAFLRPIIDRGFPAFTAPLAGLQIGERLHWLKGQLDGAKADLFEGQP